MLRHDEASRVVTLENGSLRVILDYGGGLIFKEFSNLMSGEKANEDREAFVIGIRGSDYGSADFSVTKVETVCDRVQELISVTAELPDEMIKVRLSLIGDEDSVTVLYQVWDDYKLGVPTVATMKVPLVARLEASREDGAKYYYPSGVRIGKNGEDVMKPMMEAFHSADIRLPLVVTDEDDRFGFSAHFLLLSDLNDAGATQNAAKQLSAISNESELTNHCLRINPDASFNDTVEIRFYALKEGWAEAFDGYRSSWQSRYDFSEYERDDLKWFGKCAVHNFVFLYGKEGFDHEREKMDVDGLLAQGEKFGGYDTVTIWNQYPRLGIDSRTQWDFYDDFPGGRTAIREAVESFHAKGVYVFLPYIPWDRGNDETTNSMGDEFVRMIADTDADGYQLDTMRDLPFSYRRKLDQVRPGLVLTSQHHPLKKHPVEFITTSWDEFWQFAPMPEVDVFRFICPMHIAPVVSRWLRMEDKTVLIKRCEFGGAPIVIWQDIFGRWMPFSDDQKFRIKAWKKVYLDYRSIYQGPRPIPLLPTSMDGAYCNMFERADGRERIYSFYNDEEETLCASVKARGMNVDETRIILGLGEAKMKSGILSAKLPPKEVVHVLVS